MTKRAGIWLVALALIALPQLAGAQTSGTIAGVVKDASGAVLPGATVEASSPALIEKVRVAVTDGQGNYKIIDLRPGVYTVTVTMPGFGTYKREGLDMVPGTGLLAAILFDAVGGGSSNLALTGAATGPRGTPVPLQMGPAPAVTVR